MSKIFNLPSETFDSLGKLSLDYLFVLEQAIEGNIGTTDKFAAIYQGLKRKGFLNDDYSPSDIGSSLYSQLQEGKTDVKIKKIAIEREGITGLHKKLQDKILKITGRKQAIGKIGKKDYSFLCNDMDLQNRLLKVISKYKLTDFPLIERTLLQYVEQCCNKREFFPIVEYYMIKRGDDGTERSQMVTDMQSFEEKNEREINRDL